MRRLGALACQRRKTSAPAYLNSLKRVELIILTLLDLSALSSPVEHDPSGLSARDCKSWVAHSSSIASQAPRTSHRTARHSSALHMPDRCHRRA